MSLIERLRERVIYRTGPGYEVDRLRNPDGPEAADRLEAMQAEIERLRALIRKADEIAGESLSGCHDTAFYGEWCGEVVFSDPSLDRQGK